MSYDLVPEEDFFTSTLKRRVELKYNNLSITEGEPSSGKSYADLRLCEILYPKFDPYKDIIFEPKSFLEREKELKKGAFIIFDEPALALGHRSWWKQTNIMISSRIETFRFKLISVFFSTVTAKHIDVMVRELCQFKLLMVRRGIARVYRQTHDAFTGKLWWKPLGRIAFRLPSQDIIDVYENRRAEYQEKLRKKYLKEFEAIERKGITSDVDLYEEAKSMLPELLDSRGKVNIYELCDHLGISMHKGYRLKHKLEKELHPTFKTEVSVKRKKGVKKEPKVRKELPKISDDELREWLKSV